MKDILLAVERLSSSQRSINVLGKGGQKYTKVLVWN